MRATEFDRVGGKRRDSERDEGDERESYGGVGERSIHAVEVAGAGALRLARQSQPCLAFSLLQVRTLPPRVSSSSKFNYFRIFIEFIT